MCKCEAHTKNTDLISTGNARAYTAAKAVAKQPLSHTQTQNMTKLPLTFAVISELQRMSTPEEKAQWRKVKDRV